MTIIAPETSKVLMHGAVIAGSLLTFFAVALWSWQGGWVRGSAITPQMVRVTTDAASDKPLYVQKYEVTVAEWNHCNDDGACKLRLKTPNPDAAATTPATGLNWFDVQQYLAWINRQSRAVFRLPTFAEWEALARDVVPKKPDPIFTDPELNWASAYLTTPKVSRTLRPTGSFKTTSDGIVDLNGNVWEWTSDCYAGSLTNVDESNCPAFYVGGEHIAVIPIFTRNPARGGCAVGAPPAHLGLRLVSNDTIFDT